MSLQLMNNTINNKINNVHAIKTSGILIFIQQYLQINFSLRQLSIPTGKYTNRLTTSKKIKCNTLNAVFFRNLRSNISNQWSTTSL